MSFWNKLSNPIFILAPMEGVTDTVFRQIVASVSRPDVFFTEFVPVDAILSEGSKEVLRSFQYSEKERPIVAQIWGVDPEKFYQSAKLIKKLGFDGIDINMGCPVHDVIKKGACSALIKNPKLAKEIIESTLKGAGGLPVSVKTRIGFDTIETEKWVETLLKTGISALILHLRTAREMSKVSAHWEEMKKAVDIKNKLNSKVLIIGNGDVKSLKQARELVNLYKLDGVMIGRGIFDNVYLFNEKINPEKILPSEKIALLLKHVNLYKKVWGDRHFETLKKFVKCYINNFPRSSEVREKLMRTKSMDELISEVNSLL